MRLQLSFFHDNGKFETTHEIEIPRGADKFHHEMTDRDGYVSRGWVPIPRPKQKIKKWEWIVGWKRNSRREWAHHEYTEDEIRLQHPTADWYHRIGETMIEVEE
jgi:hypothetical protein